MAYKAYVVRVKELRPHSNADRLQIATFFGNDTCVSLDTKIGDLGVYFPSDGQVSVEFAEANNLVRKKDAEGNNVGGYMDPNKRNITAIKLRGERSDGIYLPIACLESFGDITTLKEGDTIDVFNGHEICKKYIPRRQHSNRDYSTSGHKTHKNKKNLEETPYFAEHVDTPQLRFCMETFKPGDVICLTEKVHGTSSRNANTLVISHKQTWLDKLLHREGKEIQTYKYVVGTRRTTVRDNVGGYYGSNDFRIRWGEKFKGKLNPGEEVFGELAGYTDDGKTIMAIANNEKTKDKEFIKRFGPTSTFTYGCKPNTSRYFVYRMTYTSPDGYVIEYPWDLVKLRAEQMGFEVVPELDRFIYTTEEDFLARIKKWLDIPSTIDASHIIEGVVVRALNAPNLRIAKEKSWNFKVIEGIAKAEAEAPDMEEAEELLVEI